MKMKDANNNNICFINFSMEQASNGKFPKIN